MVAFLDRAVTLEIILFEGVFHSFSAADPKKANQASLWNAFGEQKKTFLINEDEDNSPEIHHPEQTRALLYLPELE